MGQLSIPDGATLYLDTAPIIYSIERHQDYWQLLTPVWEKLQLGNIQLISSDTAFGMSRYSTQNKQHCID